MINQSSSSDRITVDTTGNWRIYSSRIPVGSRALGVVHRGGGDSGALVQIESTGLYAQVNAGCIRNLPQGEVAAAIYDSINQR